MSNLRKIWRLVRVAALCAAAISQAQAAIITSNFSDLGNHNCSVNLALTNDSDAAGINEFTVYFSQSSFSNLSVLASTANWGSIVAQPDLSLAAAGFFDGDNP